MKIINPCSLQTRNILQYLLRSDHPFILLKTMVKSSQPTIAPKLEEPKFGFSAYAERLNGRAAMIGFVATLAIEYFTGQGLLAWLGL